MCNSSAELHPPHPLAYPQAAEHMRLALAIYENQLGADHQSTKDVSASLTQLEG